MSKIDQIHLRAVMLCMSKMSKIDQIHLRALHAMYVADVVDVKKTYTHSLAHNCTWYIMDFQSENKFWKAEPRAKLSQLHNRQILCMSKHVEYVEDRSNTSTGHKIAIQLSKMSKIDQIHLRAVMLLMSQTSKMGKKHTHTFLLITSLILNGFSIRKKFWKAETESFPTIPSNSMYVEACRRCRR